MPKSMFEGSEIAALPEAYMVVLDAVDDALTVYVPVVPAPVRNAVM